MSVKKTIDKYTQAVVKELFGQHAKSFDQKMDKAIQRLEHMSTNAAHALLKTDQRLDSIEDRMSTVEKKMLTKEDLKLFVTKEDAKQFATKEDLKQFATKEDLKQFATKEDLKQFATKEDLKQFATKEDLKQFAIKDDFNRLAWMVSKHEDQFEKINKKIDEDVASKDDIRDLIKTIDMFAKKMGTQETRALTNTHRLNELEPIVERHGKRLTVLENKK